MLLCDWLTTAQASGAAPNGCPCFLLLSLPWLLTLCHLLLTRTQIVEVINERKLAKTLSGFINQIFDKASHAAQRGTARLLMANNRQMCDRSRPIFVGRQA